MTDHMTPSYIAFTDSKRLIGDAEKKAKGKEEKKILKIIVAINMPGIPVLHNEYIMLI